jgi:hypothetical protein
MAEWQTIGEACPSARSKVCYTPLGQAYFARWGNLHEVANAGLVAVMYAAALAAPEEQRSHRCWARSQLLRMAGGLNYSYVIGWVGAPRAACLRGPAAAACGPPPVGSWGTAGQQADWLPGCLAAWLSTPLHLHPLTSSPACRPAPSRSVGGSYPVRTHHEGSTCPSNLAETCDWGVFNSNGPNANVLTGALVGGPAMDATFVDKRQNFQTNEARVFYVAGAAGGLPACRGPSGGPGWRRG